MFLRPTVSVSVFYFPVSLPPRLTFSSFKASTLLLYERSNAWTMGRASRASASPGCRPADKGLQGRRRHNASANPDVKTKRIIKANYVMIPFQSERLKINWWESMYEMLRVCDSAGRFLGARLKDTMHPFCYVFFVALSAVNSLLYSLLSL